jgi:predicted GIY-YIG superfamily endonuclease
MYYTGITTNLKRRLIDHNTGKQKATQGIEWEVVASISGFTRREAAAIEKYLKTGDTIAKRALFYTWVYKVEVEDVPASHFYEFLLPKMRYLKWFRREME